MTENMHSRKQRVRGSKYYSETLAGRSYGDRFEDIEPVVGRTDHGARDLWMPVDLFDVLLALVHEEKLRGHLATALGCVHGTGLFVILLDGEVPERDLVVGTRGSENGIFGWVPLDGSDRCAVPGECSYRRRIRRGTTRRNDQHQCPTPQSSTSYPVLFTFRRSHTLIPPSSPPLTKRYVVARFQLITFTSLSCARSMPATLCLPFVRTSHTRTL